MSRGSNDELGSKAQREFVSEAEEILESMRTDLADLEDQRDSGGETDPEVVNRLFRAAHSFKALAGLFQFEPVRDLAHRLEDVLDGMRLGRVAEERGSLERIGESVRVFGHLLERVGNAAQLAELEPAIRELIERIQAGSESPSIPVDALSVLDLDPSLLRALTEYEEHRVRENVRRGRRILLVESTFEIISFEEGLSGLSTAIREFGELLSTLPAPGESPESEIQFSLLVASDLTAEALATRIELPNVAVRSVHGGDAATPSAGAGAAKDAASASSAASEARPRAPESDRLESLRSISDTVRVDIRKLDELMNLVGELVIQRGALGDLIGELQQTQATARIGNDFAKVHKGLDRKLRELQSAVLDVRMVPLRQVFEKVSRVVRGLRRDLGKDVRLEIRGADTELDKLIVEALVDPLMHVVRNALDHAIEPVEERLAAGKDARGSIGLEAFQRGNHVVIAVRDDGSGIDVAALRAGAEAAGLVHRDDSLSEKETLDLVFAPGLSTRAEVTETSGRGVGMDVVRANLTALGGIVDIESVAGRGTTVSMTLPITLAIVQSLIVGAAGQRFAIPLNAVLETLLVDASEIGRTEGRELLNLRGEPLPLRRLAAEFGLDGPVPEKHFAIVMGIGDLRIGLLVDRLDGQQDTVIKAIQGPCPTVRGIAGATDLGDQDPVLVLDVSALVEDVVRRRENT